VVAVNAALTENAGACLRTAAALMALDPAAGAGSQQVSCQVESTAHPNLRASLWNGANEAAIKAASTAQVVTDPALVTRPLPGDGTNMFLSGSAANVSAKSSVNAQLAARPGDWATSSNPGVNSQASASQAAGGAGVRHVCTSISFVLAAGATAPTATEVTVNLRDGATGAGTVLMSWIIALPAVAGAMASICLSDLHVVGSAATAMTLEFAGGGGANTYESVAMTGHDCV